MNSNEKRIHRAFQCLETFYVSPNIAQHIHIGDEVTWDFERERLVIKNLEIWKIPVNRERYYGGLDSHRHKILSWVVAKEDNKIKLFTCADLLHPHADSIKSTESQDIVQNLDRILPRLKKAIGKGFWKIFENDDNFKSASLITLLTRISEIKTLADEVYLLESFTEREQKIVEIIDRIQQVNAEEIPQIRREIAENIKYDLKNIEDCWKQRLPSEVWNKLNEKVKDYLKTGEVVYRFLDELSVESTYRADWTCANVEFCKAVEVELNQKIIRRFGNWLRNNLTGLDLVLLYSNRVSKTDFWRKYLNGVKESNFTTTIPIGTIQWTFKELFKTDRETDNDFYKGLFRLLENFSAELDNKKRGFLNELSEELSELVMTRNGSLHTEFLRRKKVDRFVVKLQELFPKLADFSE